MYNPVNFVGEVWKHNETSALKAKYVFNSLGPTPQPHALGGVF